MDEKGWGEGAAGLEVFDPLWCARAALRDQTREIPPYSAPRSRRGPTGIDRAGATLKDRVGAVEPGQASCDRGGDGNVVEVRQAKLEGLKLNRRIRHGCTALGKGWLGQANVSSPFQPRKGLRAYENGSGRDTSRYPAPGAARRCCTSTDRACGAAPCKVAFATGVL